MLTENEGEAPLSGLQIIVQTIARVCAGVVGALAGAAALLLILGGMTVMWIFRIAALALPIILGGLFLYWLLA
jgi:hypothetical protein